jgi:hypothetical protein
MSDHELIKKLLPYSGKTVKRIKKWDIKYKGDKTIPKEDTTMIIWVSGQQFIIPFMLPVFTLIKALHLRNTLLIIEYRVNQRTRAIVTCKRKKS